MEHNPRLKFSKQLFEFQVTDLVVTKSQIFYMQILHGPDYELSNILSLYSLMIINQQNNKSVAPVDNTFVLCSL